jgi:hypothetical protein
MPEFSLQFSYFLLLFLISGNKKNSRKKNKSFWPWSACVAQPTWPFGLLRRAAARPGCNLGLGRASGSAAARPLPPAEILAVEPI